MGQSPAITHSLRRSRRHRGSVLIYSMVALIALLAVTSLAVDLAHVRLVKNQLQFAADSAARYGAAGLGTSIATAQSNAVAAAAENKADGSSVVLTPSTDVQLGTWSGGTFTVLTGAAQSGANALRITARRTAATGNPVHLLFAGVLGLSTCDVSATTTAILHPAAQPLGIVGLNSVTFNGHPAIDSYDSSAGAYVTPGFSGKLMSNGNIQLGQATVDGDANPGPGDSATGGTVTGNRDPLTQAITAPAIDPGNAATVNNNAAVASYLSSGDFSLSGTNVTMPPGIYYFNNFTLSGNAVLNVSGPVTIYVTGGIDLGGTPTAGSVPANLKILDMGSGAVTISGTGAYYMDLYAPNAAVSLNGNVGFYGALVGSTLQASGNPAMHFDTALLNSAGARSIAIVN